MGVRLTFFTACTASFVFAFGLSLFQQLLVLVGGILGAWISYSYVGVSTRVQRLIKYVDFDMDNLVSINDEELKCIFLRDGRCGKTITGPDQKQFISLRASVSKCPPDSLHARLRYMIEIKLCSSCWKHGQKEKCVQNYIKKWSAEVKRKLHTQRRQPSEINEHIAQHEESNVADDIGPDEPLIQWDELERDVPGAYRNSSSRELSPRVAPRGRRTSNEQRQVSDHDEQSSSIATNNLAYNTPKVVLLDALSPTAQHTPSPLLLSPQREKSPSSAGPNSTTPKTSTDGWYLARYNIAQPETLQNRILKNLQKLEIESGFIYVLRRKDEEEYYKVGFSTGDVQTRLAKHNRKCKGNWEVAWDTDKLIKHAKRVEKLIHLECEFRGLRYRESWCKTGGEDCGGQHQEIIKATYEDVIKCVKHWVGWMNGCDKYEETTNSPSPSPSPGRRISNSSASSTVWSLIDSHIANIDNPSPTDTFYLMSTGDMWVQSTQQQKQNHKRKPRSQSTSALASTPTRRLGVARSTHSDRPATRRTLRSDSSRRVPEVETPSRRRAGSMGKGMDVEL